MSLPGRPAPDSAVSARSGLRLLAVSTVAELGGGEVLLIEMLTSLQRRGACVRLIVLGDGPVVDTATARGVPTVTAPAISLRRPHTLACGVRHVRKVFEEFHPTIVHASNPKAHVVVHLACRGLGVPESVQVLDPPPRRSFYVSTARRLPGDRLAITQASGEAWARRLPGIAVRVVEPGVDAKRLQTEAEEGDASAVWARSGLGDAPHPRVIMVGRLQRYKGPYDFLEAARRVLAERPASFLIVGPDEPLEPGVRDGLDEAVRQLGLRGQVELSGRLSSPDLAAVIRDATLLVHPSSSETFGLVILEAFALETPVIAYAAPGPRLLLRGGGGALVPAGNVDQLANQLLRALADPDRQERWRDEASAVAAQFSVERMADGYLRCFLASSMAGCQ